MMAEQGRGSNPSQAGLASAGIMLLSAVIFGFFGFFYGINWNTPGVNGQDPVLFRQLCGWTLKVAAIAYGLAALLTMVSARTGNLLYAIVGLASAVMFVIIAVMDIADTQHAIMPYGPAILLIFAAWNGYGAWQGLRQVMSTQRVELPV